MTSTPAPYLVLRHGESTANVRGIIVSRLSTAEHAYGLTRRGRAQIRASVERARDDGTLVEGCRIVTSPLLRARESAELAAEILAAEVVVDGRIIERGFGSLELTSDHEYQKVWAEDVADPTHECWGVESLRSVLVRGLALLDESERGRRTWHGTAPTGVPTAAAQIVLCTHGDVASTLCCAAAGHPLGRHREVGALANAELRALGAISGIARA